LKNYSEKRSECRKRLTEIEPAEDGKKNADGDEDCHEKWQRFCTAGKGAVETATGVQHGNEQDGKIEDVHVRRKGRENPPLYKHEPSNEQDARDVEEKTRCFANSFHGKHGTGKRTPSPEAFLTLFNLLLNADALAALGTTTLQDFSSVLGLRAGKVPVGAKTPTPT
jgi:hypothetical protein